VADITLEIKIPNDDRQLPGRVMAWALVALRQRNPMTGELEPVGDTPAEQKAWLIKAIRRDIKDRVLYFERTQAAEQAAAALDDEWNDV